MTRTRITQDPATGIVTISYTDWMDGSRIERAFSAPIDRPGYVREWTDNGGSRQPCEALSYRGNTLIASPETLLAAIRREYQRMRRQERAESRIYY